MKRYFLSRSGREKALLLAFAGIAALIWLFSATGRIRVLWQERNSLKAEHETQQTWLANRTAIEARAAAAVHQLDPAQTLNGTRLVGELNALATSAGLSAEVSGQRTERTVQFAFHSAQVSFRRADLGSLVRFYEALSARSPYVGLEQMTLTVDRGAPGQLNATFRVVAAELTR
jgi:hypothetical protein